MRIVFLLLVAAVATAMSKEIARIPSNKEPGWYAPSRKAPIYAHKYQGLLNKLTRQETKQGEGMRLPRDVLPTMYNIRLLPFIEEGNFTTDGYIEIDIDCVVATKNISMNAAELTFKSIKVVDIDAPTVNLNTVNVDKQEEQEIITIQMENELKAGKKYKVTIEFISILNTDLRGFYRSSYEESGKTKYLAVSQMEAPDARRAFPCFDEPNMKAVFKITLGHKSPSMTALSNMPVDSDESIPGLQGYRWVHFKPSVKMSSYLVAMMVSEFISKTSDPFLSPGVDFKIWSRPSYINQTEYAANIGPRILDKYVTDYFKINFPLPKVDMAAIPDFAAGAMENWGLITYREADLLYDDARSSATAKQRVAIIIAHELAHQWFGNLVTMDWWNVLWLNEGFASYMEYPGTDYVEPGFEMNEQFTVTDLHYVFGIDALESSRPIDYTVNTPAEINQMFDAISYEKGSCIIRMCANFLGEPTFRRGITRYLNTNAFGNTVQEDLWKALQLQADEESVILPAPIKTIMTTWTKQMGYPVVSVTRSYDWTNSAYVKQERFLLRKSNSSADNNDYRWWIPLTYTSNFTDSKIGYHWYPNEQGKDTILILEGSSANKWVIFNVGQEGYYRVVYDEKNLEMIRQQLMTSHGAISKKNRAQIVDDYLNLARANFTSYVTAMELTRYLKFERDYAPWTAASDALEYIDTMLYSYSDEKYWKEYMTGLVGALYDYVDYTEGATDAHLKIYTRSEAIYWACGKLNISDCVQNAKADYKLWMDTGKQLSANLRRSIVCTAIANGGRAEWDFGFDKYVASDQANEKTDLLRSITCSTNVTIINEMLNKMITPDSGIRLQDANTLFANIAANPVGHQVALDFLTNRWNDVSEYYGSYQGFGGGSIPGLFRSLCSRVNTEAKLQQLTKLRTDHMDVLGSSKTVSQGLELAQANLAWISQHYTTIATWLRSQTVVPTTAAPVITTPSSASVLYVNNLVIALIMVIMGFCIY